MPAPDLGRAVREDAPDALTVHPVGELADAASFRGAAVVMIDQLRASSSIASALASGAAAVHPVRTVEEARELAGRLGSAALAGERSGIRPEGFEIGNTPSDFTPERVGGRPVVCTTTNGTAALLHAATTADTVVVGCLANRAAVCGALAGDPRPVHILCAGTRGGVSLDDLIAAGAFVERLMTHGRPLSEDDSSRVALRAWEDASASGVEAALLQTRGGRNLAAVGLDADVEWCARVDHLDVVPVFGAGAITSLPTARPARPA